MNKRKTAIALLATGALAVVALFGAFTYRAVSAQAPTATPASPSTQGQTVPPGQGMKGHDGVRGGYSEADLAAALGITTDQLQAAYQTANTEALKEAVSKGLITQAQADQLAARGDTQRPLGGFGRFGGTNDIDYNAILAKALGISTDKLQAAYQQALNTSLATAVKNGTMTQQQADEISGRSALANDTTFQSAIKAAFEAAVKQAVSSGVITQAQADAILQSQSQPAGDFFPGFGHGRGHGFGGPGFNGQPGTDQNNGGSPANPTPSTSSTTNGL